MRFYDMLQLDPGTLKKKIRSAELPKERRKLMVAITVRTFLIVMFAILLISPAGKVFGAENSPMAVALFCILLGIRFVDFDYCIKDSMINFAVVLMLLLFAPCLTARANALLALLIHISAFFVILFMTSGRPEMGNSGLYTFAYIYLSSNPVFGDQLWRRVLLTLVGYVLCGAILLAKHHNKNQSVRFWSKMQNFSLADNKNQWLLQLTLGVSIVLTVGNLFHLPRAMWAAYACGSIVGCYSATGVEAKGRAIQRMIGTIIGSLAFFVVYSLLPVSLKSMVGPLGGLCAGFCTKYRYQIACNCLGALFMATSLFSVPQTMVLRLGQNLVGLLFGVVFLMLYQKVMSLCFASKTTGGAQNPTT